MRSPFLDVARAYVAASYVLLDTPGQIEIFTWSASGAIITDALASSLPTVVAYVIDTPRTTAPATFMSNMLYACSILYKTKLPFILVFNKTDVQSHAFAVEWMRDFEEFQAALATHSGTNDSEGEPTYMNSLMNSMSLVLDEFYKHLKVVGVSSMTGDGITEFFEAVDASRDEYEKCVPPVLRSRHRDLMVTGSIFRNCNAPVRNVTRRSKLPRKSLWVE